MARPSLFATFVLALCCMALIAYARETPSKTLQPSAGAARHGGGKEETATAATTQKTTAETAGAAHHAGDGAQAPAHKMATDNAGAAAAPRAGDGAPDPQALFEEFGIPGATLEVLGRARVETSAPEPWMPQFSAATRSNAAHSRDEPSERAAEEERRPIVLRGYDPASGYELRLTVPPAVVEEALANGRRSGVIVEPSTNTGPVAATALLETEQPAQTSFNEGVPFARVRDNSNNPYCSVGAIGNPARPHCSGVLIGRRVVLTAAHCLFRGATRSYEAAPRLSFTAGVNGRSGDPLNHARATMTAHHAWVPNEYATAPLMDVGFGRREPGLETRSSLLGGQYRFSHDWGLIILNQPADACGGAFLGAPWPDGRYNLVTTLEMVGYPGTHTAELWSDTCAIRAANPRSNVGEGRCDIAGGMSGGPAFWRPSQNVAVVSCINLAFSPGVNSMCTMMDVYRLGFIYGASARYP